MKNLQKQNVDPMDLEVQENKSVFTDTRNFKVWLALLFQLEAYNDVVLRFTNKQQHERRVNLTKSLRAITTSFKHKNEYKHELDNMFAPFGILVDCMLADRTLTTEVLDALQEKINEKLKSENDTHDS